MNENVEMISYKISSKTIVVEQPGQQVLYYFVYICSDFPKGD